MADNRDQLQLIVADNLHPLETPGYGINNLMTLPDDLLLSVISKLPLPEIFTLLLVNKKLYEFIQRNRDYIVNPNWVPKEPFSSIVAKCIIEQFPNILFDSLKKSDTSARRVFSVKNITFAQYPKNFTGIVLRANFEHYLFTLMPGFREYKHAIVFTTRSYHTKVVYDYGRFGHLSSLELYGAELSDADVKTLSVIPKLNIHSCVGNIDLTFLKGVPYLSLRECTIKNWDELGAQHSLAIKNCELVGDGIMHVEKMGSVKKLVLEKCNTIDISPIANVPELHIIWCRSIRNFNVLGSQEILTLFATDVIDVSNLSKVKHISLASTRVIDYSPLANADAIMLVSYENCNVTALYKVPHLNITIYANNSNPGTVGLFPGFKSTEGSNQITSYVYRRGNKASADKFDI